MTTDGDGPGETPDPDAGDPDPGDAADPDPAAAVEAFLAEADAVFDEFDRGYVDADVALTRLRRGIDELRDATED